MKMTLGQVPPVCSSLRVLPKSWRASIPSSVVASSMPVGRAAPRPAKSETAVKNFILKMREGCTDSSKARLEKRRAAGRRVSD